MSSIAAICQQNWQTEERLLHGTLSLSQNGIKTSVFAHNARWCFSNFQAEVWSRTLPFASAVCMSVRRFLMPRKRKSLIAAVDWFFFRSLLGNSKGRMMHECGNRPRIYTLDYAAIRGPLRWLTGKVAYLFAARRHTPAFVLAFVQKPATIEPSSRPQSSLDQSSSH